MLLKDEKTSDILKAKFITIRDFAKIIGKMVAAEPRVKYAFIKHS